MTGRTGVRATPRGLVLEEHERLYDPRTEIAAVYGSVRELERERLIVQGNAFEKRNQSRPGVAA